MATSNIFEVTLHYLHLLPGSLVQLWQHNFFTVLHCERVGSIRKISEKASIQYSKCRHRDMISSWCYIIDILRCK